MTAAALTAPLDVLKTRLQSDFYQKQLHATRAEMGINPHATLSPARSALLHFRETFQILFSVHKVEGWRALFKGLGPNLVGVVPARSINFFTYGNGKRVIADNFNGGKENAWVVLFAAATAGIVTSTATNPIWMVKTRLQLDKSTVEKEGGAAVRRYKNSWDCIKSILREEGIKGMYKGMSASYLGVTESTLQWVLYEQMKEYLTRRENEIIRTGREKNWWDNTVEWTGRVGAAGSAKLVAALLTYPHEVRFTRFHQSFITQTNKTPGRSHTPPSSTNHSWWKAKVHRLDTVLQARLEGGRYSLHVRRLDATSSQNSTKCRDHVRNVRADLEVACD